MKCPLCDSRMEVVFRDFYMADGRFESVFRCDQCRIGIQSISTAFPLEESE